MESLIEPLVFANREMIMFACLAKDQGEPLVRVSLEGRVPALVIERAIVAKTHVLGVGDDGAVVSVYCEVGPDGFDDLVDALISGVEPGVPDRSVDPRSRGYVPEWAETLGAPVDG